MLQIYILIFKKKNQIHIAQLISSCYNKQVRAKNSHNTSKLSLIKRDLNLLYSRMLYAEFGCNWSSGSGV